MLRALSTPRHSNREIAHNHHAHTAIIATAITLADLTDPVERLSLLWSQSLGELTGRSAETRQRASATLRLAVDAELAVLPAFDDRQRVVDELTIKLNDLVNTSSDNGDKLSGLSVVEELLALKADTVETLIPKFANILRILFAAINTNTDPRVIEAATRTLGRLGRSGGALTVDFIHYHIKQAMDWLAQSSNHSHSLPHSTTASTGAGSGVSSVSDRNDKRQLAAVYTLKELSEQTPALFSTHFHSFFDLIWFALRDLRPDVREVAAKALKAALSDLSKRSTLMFNNISQSLLNEATAILTGQSVTPTHSHLLHHHSHLGHHHGGMHHHHGHHHGHHHHSLSMTHSSSSVSLSVPSSPMIGNRSMLLGQTHGSPVSPAPSPGPVPTLSPSSQASGTLSRRVSVAPSSSVHGALLVLASLLSHNTELMTPHFPFLFDLTYKQRDSKDGNIVRTVISLIPQLASLRADTFVSQHCQWSMDYCLSHCDSNDSNSDSAIRALGSLIELLGDNVRSFVDTILTALIALLTASHSHTHTGNQSLLAASKKRSSERETEKSKRNQRNIDATLTCLAVIGRHLPQSLQHFGPAKILDSMFLCPLSPSLIETCRVLVVEAPSMGEECEERLSDLLITVLCRPWLAPMQVNSATVGPSLTGSTTSSPGHQTHALHSHHSHSHSHSSLSSLANTTTIANSTSRDALSAINAGNSTTGSGSASSMTDGDGKFTAPYTLPRHLQLHKLSSSLSLTQSPIITDLPLTMLAFDTLSTFPFHFATQYALLAFARYCLTLYCDDDSSSVRKAACECCVAVTSKMYEAFSVAYHATSQSLSHLSAIIGDIVRKLVTMAVTDTDSAIRLLLMTHFANDSRIDRFLCQAELLSALFLALHDEVTAIRESTILLLGRLSSKNPAVILPTLRKILLELLTELQSDMGNSGQPLTITNTGMIANANTSAHSHTGSHHRRGLNQEDSAKLLGHLIGSCHALIKPYVDSILGVLVPKLGDVNGSDGNGANTTAVVSAPGLVSSVLSTLGQLSVICGSDMAPFLDHLFPLLLDSIVPAMLSTTHTNTSAASVTNHKQIALRTLSLLLSSTACVMTPYVKYPSLLPSLLLILKTEKSRQVRFEAMRLIGVIGAIDPKQQRKCQQQFKLLFENLSASKSLTSDGRSGSHTSTMTNHGGRRGTHDSHRSVIGSAATGASRHDEDSKESKDGDGNDSAEMSGSVNHTATIIGPGPGNGDSNNHRVTRVHGVNGAGASLPSLDEDDASHHSLFLCRSGNYDEYWPSVAIAALMRTVTDPRLANYHSLSLHALMFILTTLGKDRSLTFLPSIVPVFVAELTSNDSVNHSDGQSLSSHRELLLLNLSSLIALTGDAMKPWCDAVVELCVRLWPPTAVITGIGAPLAPLMIAATASLASTTPLLNALLSCLEQICINNPQHLQSHLMAITQRCLGHFTQTPTDSNLPSTLRVLGAIRVFANYADLSSELHAVFPALLDLCESDDSRHAYHRLPVRVAAVNVIGVIVTRHDCSSQASRIIQPFARILSQCVSMESQQLFNETLSVICNLIPQLPFTFCLFEPIITRAIREKEHKERSGASGGCQSMASTPSNAQRSIVSDRESVQVTRYQRIIGKLRTKLLDLRDQSHYHRTSTVDGESRTDDDSDSVDGRGLNDSLTLTREKRKPHRRATHTSSSASNMNKFAPVTLERSHSGDSSLSGKDRCNSIGKADDSSLSHYSLLAAASTLPIDTETLDDYVPTAESTRGSPSMRGSSPSPALTSGTPPIDSSFSVDTSLPPASSALSAADAVSMPLLMNQFNLRQSFVAPLASTSEDWFSWLKSFQLELLRENPSFALRACSMLAAKHSSLARELMTHALLSCWREMDDPVRDELIENFDAILESFIANTHTSIPHEIIVTILGIAEYCDRHNCPLPLRVERLASAADRCNAHYHALYYYEKHFTVQPSTAISSLISVNNKLQLTEAAAGVLAYADIHYNDRISPKWYEKLHQYEEALNGYEWKQLTNFTGSLTVTSTESDSDSDEANLLGRLRCLKELQQWERLAALAANSFNDTTDDTVRTLIAPFVSSALHHLRCWDLLELYFQYLPASSFDGCFYRALFYIHCDSMSLASTMIDKAIESLDSSLTTVVSESYNRAYPNIVRLQQCAELQEIIAYKQSGDDKKSTLRKMWAARIEGTERAVSVWSDLLAVRSMVMNPKDDINVWLNYATLARKSGKMSLSLNVLTALMGFDPTLFVVAASTNTTSGSLAPLPESFPQLSYACLKHLYAAGHRRSSYNRLLELVNSPTMQAADTTSAGRSDGIDRLTMDKLKARCYLKLGDWQMDLNDGLSILNYYDTDYHQHRDKPSPAHAQAPVSTNAAYNSILPQVLNYFHAATVCDHGSFKAWHQWAMMNFTVVQRNKLHSNQSQSQTQQHSHRNSISYGTEYASVPSFLSSHQSQTPHSTPLSLSLVAKRSSISLDAKHRPPVNQRVDIHAHLVPAIHGFFRSLWLQKFNENSRQDVLRVLQLWFEYGYRTDVNEAMIAGINTISIDTWLAVIPQMIARLHTPYASIRALLQELLAKIGKAHPQSLVWTLVVASKSHSEARRQSSLHVLNTIKSHSPHLVSQASMVSIELVRVAILTHELWHEGIEEASRYWFGQNNFDGMLAVLRPLHEMMTNGPETIKEQQFHSLFAAELEQAWRYLSKYMAAHHPSKDWLTRAWEIYSDVFRKIGKQFGNDFTSLELTEVSTKLLNAHDLQLAVPGSYRAGQPVIRIAQFEPTMRIIESKQHPRRLTIIGSNGFSYAFLLKGHEDLRQDERVMQLFGLVNTFLTEETLQSHRHTSGSSNNENVLLNPIARYAVIPLSPNSGLIEWVPHCDTMHAVIKQYRDANHILLNSEQRLMLKRAPDFQLLSITHKLEVFEHALSHTSDQHLAEALWLKSRSMQTWLEHRQVYTKSLAVMSMVGYVLGLGDRHPSNLMIDRVSGQVIHIDFGDCFDVAQTREKYPERVPFRLTRMLVAAMEVSGIRGTFLSTCRSVMTTMRKNKNSVMALLEAFVYDPLINWRLLEAKQRFDTSNDDNGENGTTASPGNDSEAEEKSSETVIDPDVQLMRRGSSALASRRPSMHASLNPPVSAILSVGTNPVTRNRRRSVIAVVEDTMRERRLDDAAHHPSTSSSAVGSITGPASESESEQLNERALSVIHSINRKLRGTDFLALANSDADSASATSDGNGMAPLEVSAQVDKLIEKATAHLNLCQSYIGWCPFW